MTHVSLLVHETRETILKKLTRACKRTGVTLTKVDGQTTILKTVWREVEKDHGLILNSEPRTEMRAFTVGALFDRYTLDGFPGISGHEFVCRIEHTQAGNILSGESVDGWREAKPTCDHCNTKRRRNDTFVLRSTETGALVRVGRNCLADFLRTDPTALVAFSEVCKAIGEALDDDGGFGGSSYWEPSPEHFIACACSAIDVEGFRKSTFDNSTVSAARFLAGPRPKNDLLEAWKAGQPNAHHVARAEAILAWLKTADDSSDYIYNLTVAAALPGVTRRTGGILASAPQAYAKALGDSLVRKAKGLPASEWIGTKDERIEVTAELVFEHTVESHFGSKTLLKFRTADGANVVWWNSGSTVRRADGAHLEIGDRVTVKGTVKAHDEYKGAKQTTLTRCKVTHIATEEQNAA